MRRRTQAAAAAAICAAVVAPTTLAGAGTTGLITPMAAPTDDQAQALSADCFSRHVSGTGVRRFETCFSSHGNVTAINHFTEYDHINANGAPREGYILCDATTGAVYADTGVSETGNWNEPGIAQPNGPNTLPLTIVRKTKDNRWELRQAYTINSGDARVTVTMTVRNTGADTRRPYLARYVDANVDGTVNGDRADTSVATLWFKNSTTASGSALTLTMQTPERPRATVIQAFPGAQDACLLEHDSVAVPTGQADWAGQINVEIPSLRPGAQAATKYQYAIQ